ncbi:MAG: four helix bundle protein [Candidatus Faecousia sp.]|nr:four helix bundle protein [Candidatus Faecousia sp.]
MPAAPAFRHQHRCECGRSAAGTKDFVAKLSIFLKEAVETNYWLRLLKATDDLSESEYNSIITDCIELEKMLTSIVKTTKSSGQ